MLPKAHQYCPCIGVCLRAGQVLPWNIKQQVSLDHRESSQPESMALFAFCVKNYTLEQFSRSVFENRLSAHLEDASKPMRGSSARLHYLHHQSWKATLPTHVHTNPVYSLAGCWHIHRISSLSEEKSSSRKSANTARQKLWFDGVRHMNEWGPWWGRGLCLVQTQLKLCPFARSVKLSMSC